MRGAVSDWGLWSQSWGLGFKVYTYIFKVYGVQALGRGSFFGFKVLGLKFWA